MNDRKGQTNENGQNSQIFHENEKGNDWNRHWGLFGSHLFSFPDNITATLLNQIKINCWNRFACVFERSQPRLESIWKKNYFRGNGREVIIYLFQGVTSHALTPGPVLIFASTLCPVADAKVFILFFSVDIESSLCAKDMKKIAIHHSTYKYEPFFPPTFWPFSHFE